MQDDEEELQRLLAMAHDRGPLTYHSPQTPKEMVAVIWGMSEDELPGPARRELIRLVELEEVRLYRDVFSGEWKVWQELTLEQAENNVDSRRWLAQWVADFQQS